ncbi:AtpZ/AtpI family protein [uncultured Draconibacterium sp.]|uniref:AtpZ/AtpI family protein n=1 Tax=uncultured Draconibacterium sp. TaxID=1573823 RepID=UPI0025DF067C|nr:AtpZ/AtpI family protein [uncultured Draconibacterium sp.]
MKNKKAYTTKKANSFIRYSGLGFEMMATIAGFTFLGYKIDQWMQNEFKGFTLGLMILGVLVAIIYGIRNLLKTENKSKKSDRK